MNMQTDLGDATLSLRRSNGQALTFHEIPALTHAAHGALENYHVGAWSTGLLGAVLALVLAGTGIYFLAVSSYVITVLAPLFQTH